MPSCPFTVHSSLCPWPKATTALLPVTSIWLLLFLLVHLSSYRVVRILHVFWIQIFCPIDVLQIFSFNLCLEFFILSTVVFKEQNSLMLIKSNLSIFLLSIVSVSTSQRGFPCGSVGKESACNAGNTGDTGSVSGWERSPGEENGNALQHSCLENPMDRGEWTRQGQLDNRTTEPYKPAWAWADTYLGKDHLSTQESRVFLAVTEITEFLC